MAKTAPKGKSSDARISVPNSLRKMAELAPPPKPPSAQGSKKKADE